MIDNSDCIDPDTDLSSMPVTPATDKAHSVNSISQIFFRMGSGFWAGETRSSAWALTGGLVGSVLLGLANGYGMNVWNRLVFDALQNKQARAVAVLSVVYLVLLGTGVMISLGQAYVRLTLQQRWRAWMTGRNIVDKWLGNGRYYQLNLIKGDHDNPEARIADDVRIATEAPVDFFSGLLQAVLSVFTFIAVLWTIGGSLDLRFIGLPLPFLASWCSRRRSMHWGRRWRCCASGMASSPCRKRRTKPRPTIAMRSGGCARMARASR